jgi:imidazole glycerol phosphate synthase glutamine amidotransferase subunit
MTAPTPRMTAAMPHNDAAATPRIAVVDYGAGNLVSIDQALTMVGAAVDVVRDPDAIRDADALLVPGVGAAGPAMDRLARRGLVDPIRDWIGAGRPFLGICLGLQLLFDGSDEDGATTLGIIPGRTILLTDAPTLPHIGWNQVERVRSHPLFDGIEPDADFYFVHSYAGEPIAGDDGASEPIALARTTLGGSFVSAVARGSLVGVQFHPERSGRDGLRLLANYVGLVRSGRWPSTEAHPAASGATATVAV